MRLKKLYISKYKNLNELIIDFESGLGLSMLIGNNGSGKSNVLEVLSAIFFDAHRKSRLFFSKAEDKYCIEYIIDDKSAIIERRSNKRYFRYDNKLLSQNKFIRDGRLPNNVISVYSGEEDRLWTSFYEPYYRAYINRTKSNLPQERMKLMFVNKYYWNIALLILLLSANETLKPFIENELHINSIENIEFDFNLNKLEVYENALLKTFVTVLSRNGARSVEYTYNSLKEAEMISQLPDSEKFNLFVQAFMPKADKIITDIKIHINNCLTTEALSEGEKKLILVKAVLELLADERTLILFDEPDAHIHEGRKRALYEMLIEYVSFNRQIVMTTHSPTMAQIADSCQLIMLNASDGHIEIVSSDKIEKVKCLTSDIWTISEQTLFFNSDKPLLLVEGKSDTAYIKQAIKLLSVVETKYSRIDMDVLPFGGAANAKHFINELKPCVNSNKKVIVLFDRDESGGNGIKEVINKGKDRDNTDTYIFDGWYYLKLPKTNDHTEHEFVIEDYFSRAKKRAVAKSIIDLSDGAFNCYPKELRQKIKESLEKDLYNYASVEFTGFAILLDKLLAILDGTETIVQA